MTASSPPNPLPPPGAYAADRLNLRIHFRRQWQIVRRRWALLALCALAGLGTALYVALSRPDIYQAVAVLGVAPRIQTSFTSQAQYQEVLDNFYLNQLEYMRGPAVLGRVEERLRADRSAASIVPAYERRAVRGQGSFFQLVVESPDATFAQRYAELWAKEFVNYKTQIKNDAFDRTARVTRDEVIRYEDRLKAAREAIQEFKKTHNIGSVKETGAAAQQLLEQLLAEQSKFSTLRQLLENTSKEDIASGALLDKNLAAADKPGRAGAAGAAADTADPLAKFNTGSRYRELKVLLRGKEADRQRCARDLKPRHPFMVALAAEIEKLEHEMGFELDLIEESRRATLASYAKNERGYEPLIEKHKKIVLDSSSTQDAFRKLEEEETLLKDILDKLRKSLKDVELSLSNIEEDLSISQAGALQPEPVAPKRPKIVLLGLLLGLGAGLALVYFLHRIDDRLDLAEDIERELQEPVLGQVPHVDPGAETDAEGRLFIPRLPQHHVFPESIRGVRSAVLLGAGNQARQVLLVTSAVPGDGKTTFTVNFACTLASVGQQVLLVDADLRRGSAHTFFPGDREPGLSNVLAGELHWSDAIRDSGVPHLKILTSGPLPTNPAGLLVGPVTGALIAELRESFDAIIIDSPPLTGINDAFGLARFVDGVLFVVRAGQTSMRFARMALAALKQREANVVGLVLNGITADNPSYYYQQYYHAYYSNSAQDIPDGARPLSAAPRMAAPAARAGGMRSIAAEAHARAGSAAAADSPTDEEHRAERFKARRAGRRDGGAAGANDKPAAEAEAQEPPGVAG